MSTRTLSPSSRPSMWQDFSTRVWFKIVLPRRRRAMLEGITLDISELSVKMKNFILTKRYEVQERRLASRLLSREDVVLELGGAIGFIGLYCRKVLGIQHVTSIEANPETIKLLRRNYALNKLEPHVIHAAAAGADGMLDLNVGGEFWENSITGHAGSSRTVRVPAKSLASLVAAMPQAPTVLICDIEGAEMHLQFGQLPATVCKIIMELHPSMIGGEPTQRVLDRLQALGFVQVAQEDDVVALERPTSK